MTTFWNDVGTPAWAKALRSRAPKAPASLGFLPPVPLGQVMFTSEHGESVVAWVNGVAKPLPGGFGGYGSTQRTARRARTTYQGVDVDGMTVPVLLDGWAARRSVATDRRRLEAMASPSGPGELTPPQPVFVTGSVPIPDRWWVIQSLEPGDNVRLRDSDGAVLRQDYAIVLIQPPEDGIIVTNGKRYTVRKGDTLRSIAATQLGDVNRWREIRDSKGRAIRDPKNVKPDQVVRLP